MRRYPYFILVVEETAEGQISDRLKSVLSISSQYRDWVFVKFDQHKTQSGLPAVIIYIICLKNNLCILSGIIAWCVPLHVTK